MVFLNPYSTKLPCPLSEMVITFVGVALAHCWVHWLICQVWHNYIENHTAKMMPSIMLWFQEMRRLLGRFRWGSLTPSESLHVLIDLISILRSTTQAIHNVLTARMWSPPHDGSEYSLAPATDLCHTSDMQVTSVHPWRPAWATIPAMFGNWGLFPPVSHCFVLFPGSQAPLLW